MPIYCYQCSNCKEPLEESRKVAEREALKPCHKCGEGYFQPVIALTAQPQFKGSGFYQTDYKKPKG